MADYWYDLTRKVIPADIDVAELDKVLKVMEVCGQAVLQRKLLSGFSLIGELQEDYVVECKMLRNRNSAYMKIIAGKTYIERRISALLEKTDG